MIYKTKLAKWIQVLLINNGKEQIAKKNIVCKKKGNATYIADRFGLKDEKYMFLIWSGLVVILQDNLNR